MALNQPRPLKVLVVDDNNDAADSTALLLGLSGYEVEVAYSGLDGLQKAETQIPDVALIDIAMPHMDGYRLAERLKELPCLSKLVLVALSGFGRDEDKTRSFNAGFSNHLIKPVALEELNKVLSAIRNQTQTLD